MLQGKKILLAITGSIAAYKAVALVRLLVKQQAEVKVIMTSAAQEFVSPLVLTTLSKNEVLTDMFFNHTWANHVMLGRWADVMLIAPLSCNTLSKMATGCCDNLLQAVYLSATCPVMVAPAMDEDMWHHPATKNNIQLIQSRGNVVLQPRNGELASGLVGDGRMEEPEAIVVHLTRFLQVPHPLQDLAGKKVMITAGPTHEAIDPVRFIGNHSSGKMGIALAQECKRRGATVLLIAGPITAGINDNSIDTIHVQSAADMYEACHKHFKHTDIGIMAAAVADYTPAIVSDVKIKKTDAELNIALVRTEDILKSLGAIKTEHQILTGFALETHDAHKNALKKLQTKNADIIVLNTLSDGAAFGADTNKITLYTKSGQVIPFASKPKTAVAKDIVDVIVQQLDKK